MRTAAVTVAVLLFVEVSSACAGGGTSIIARKGKEAGVSSSLPAGTEKLINHSSRTTGWNSWFTEWPNDVNHYAFEVGTTIDVNELIKQLALVQSDKICIHLSNQKEPSTLGWTTRLKEGNSNAAVFSVGNQKTINQWYKNVRKPFGVMEFVAAPVAVPPTLTIFVGNLSVNLEQLEIPKNIKVTFGNVPGVFHKSNTKQEKAMEGDEAKRERREKFESWKKELSSEEKNTVTRIETLIDQRNQKRE